MTDSNGNIVPGSGNEPAGSNNEPAGGAEDQNVEMVPKSLFEEANSNWRSLQGRHQQNVNKIRELSEENERLKAAQVKAPDSDKEKLTMASQIQELQQRVQKSEQREERLKKGASRSALIAGLTKSNADPELAELAADSILANNGPNILAVENDGGAYNVIYKDITGVDMPITEFAKSYMETEKGKRIRSPKLSPSLGGTLGNAAGSQGPVKKIRARDWQNLTPEQQKAHKYEFIPD
jgi:hypothetical protein